MRIDTNINDIEMLLNFFTFQKDDHSRIILQTTGSDDYINANYIKVK